MLLNYEEGTKRKCIIRQFVRENRERLTIYRGIAAEKFGIMNSEEYEKFTNSLSLSELVGDYCICLTNTTIIEYMQKVNDNEISFSMFIKLTDPLNYEKYMERA